MTIKAQISQILTERGQISLKEIYPLVNTKPENIRAILNASVKKNGIFRRVSKGVYSLNGSDVKKSSQEGE